MSAARRRALAASLALVALGCTGSGRLVADLEQRSPQLARFGTHRLEDLRPYYLPYDGSLWLFLCRWETQDPIPVALPSVASPSERRAIDAVLTAWESAGLGVRFERRWGERFRGWGIEIVLREEFLSYEANTLADCAVDLAGLAPGSSQLPARMVRASIHVASGDLRLTGTLLHEMGHALGFQGHARGGKTVMLRDLDALRAAGEAAMQGRFGADAALTPLYALPSGSVLRRSPYASSRTLDRLAARALEAKLIGPLLRAGDREGRIAWVEPDGEEVVLLLQGLQQARSDAAKLEVLPSAAARRWLDAH